MAGPSWLASLFRSASGATHRGSADLRGYVICTTQRSGSNHLCEVLASTGVLGHPLDYFNAEGRRAKGWADYPTDPGAQLDAILRHAPTPNGVYGFKLFAQDVGLLTGLDWTARLPNLEWIYLRREDLLGQAISLLKAKQTGQWRSTGEKTASAAYNAPALRAELAELARADAQWRLYFARNEIAHLELTYEALIDAPQTVVAKVAERMEVRGARVDRDRLKLDVQRDAASAIWRERFLWEERNHARLDTLDAAAGAPPAKPAKPAARPRLTVSIVARNAERRLPRLLAEAQTYADEILVGVDASSSDATLALACAYADKVYRFTLPKAGQMAPVRNLALQYATGDWVLSLDDDEGMGEGFADLLPELMAASDVTHYHFRRKWIVADDPGEYLHVAPWYPNWARRMFRNDRSRVWKPDQVHSQYYVMGPGRHEDRAFILHFEPLMCSPEERQAKIEAYREAGASKGSEGFYDLPAHSRRAVTLRAAANPLARAVPAEVDETVHALEPTGFPPWGAEVMGVQMPASAAPGAVIGAEVRVRNTGRLTWALGMVDLQWPMLRLSYHILHPDGSTYDPNGTRTVVPHEVEPGEEALFTPQVVCPSAPGEYLIEWDMLNETECWFSQCGSVCLRTPLSVA